MPGGDGAGPLGWGPRSGRGMGYCAGFGAPGYGRPFFGRRFRGYGYPWPRGYQEAAAEVDERTALQQQVGFLREQVRLIEARLKEIDGPGEAD